MKKRGFATSLDNWFGILLLRGIRFYAVPVRPNDLRVHRRRGSGPLGCSDRRRPGDPYQYGTAEERVQTTGPDGLYDFVNLSPARTASMWRRLASNEPRTPR